MATQSSNKSLYWIIGIIVLAVVLFGGFKLWHHSQIASLNSNQPAKTDNTNNPSPSTTTGSVNSGLSNKDTSNQQLDQDMQSVQNSMNQLQQDQGTSNQDTVNQSQDIPQQ